MKTILLLTLTLILFSFSSSAQWKLKELNKHDLIYCNAYIKQKGLSLKMRLLDTNVVLYLKGNYFSDNDPLVTLEIFKPDGVVYHSIKSKTGYYDDIVILTSDLEDSKILKDLKKSYAIKITIHDHTIGNSYVTFNTKNTEEAINFVR
jgi:hypothetical protein